METRVSRIDWKSIYPEEPDCVKHATEDAIKQIKQNEQIEQIGQKEQIEQIQQNEQIPQYEQIEHSENVIFMQTAGRKRKTTLKKMVLIVAMLSLLSGITVLAASSLWKQRMEEMPQEELTDHYKEVHMSSIFRYSRNLSEEELGRMDSLRKEYEEEGLFPIGELKYVSIDEYDGLGIGFDVEKGVFCLPQEALADEEILELIDFQEKLDYSLSEINQQITEGIVEQDEVMPETKAQKGIDTMVDFENYNDMFFYRVVHFDSAKFSNDTFSNDALSSDTFNSDASHSAEEYMLFSADNHYLYLGSKYQIIRCLHGEETGEVFYQADEGERIFAMYADDAGHVLVSLADDADMSGQNKRLIRLNDEGTVECEYGLDQVTSDTGENLSHYFPYKMTVAEDGTLFLKFRGFSDENVLAYVFDEQGVFKGRVESRDYSVSDWGAMCIGRDGYLYMLGRNKNANQLELLKVDRDTLFIEDATELIGADVTVFFDDMVQMSENELMLTGYDGVCIADVKTGDVQCAIHGYDEKWFDEGAKFACIDENNLVILKRGIADESGVMVDSELIYLRRK
ncbi:MAG: hypothetical protein ACI4FV_09050 [Lachnospiraceae bacterium]